MSKCDRQTCLFITSSDSEKYCCKGCKRNGVHGPACEGLSFKASPDTMVAAEFNFALCNASSLADSTIMLRLVWNAVPNATCYKLLRGGESPIVLNSLFNNTYINHTGCFESNSDLRITKNISEYLTINTNYSFTYEKSAFFTAGERKHLTFLVYPYFGNIRGPVPTKVLCVDFFPTLGVADNYTGVAQLRPNISVSLFPDRFTVPETTRHRVYQYYNHFTKQKQIRRIPWRSGPVYVEGEFKYNLVNNALQYNGALEKKTLFGVFEETVPTDEATDGPDVILAQ